MLADLKRRDTSSTREERPVGRGTRCMSGREFVDTNVLVYAFDRTAGAKREAAIGVARALVAGTNGVCQPASAPGIPCHHHAEALHATGRRPSAGGKTRLGKWRVHRPALEDVLASIELHRRKRVSFWYAMIPRSAAQLGCSVL